MSIYNSEFQVVEINSQLSHRSCTYHSELQVMKIINFSAESHRCTYIQFRSFRSLRFFLFKILIHTHSEQALGCGDFFSLEISHTYMYTFRASSHGLQTCKNLVHCTPKLNLKTRKQNHWVAMLVLEIASPSVT